MGRLHNLDYLRGLAAFGIMIYHYLTWSSGEFSSDTFMGKLGIYGVSIFYILSGLTLYYVYINRMLPSGHDVKEFFKKRIFRIFPLLWLVTLASIVLAKQKPDFLDVFLNLSGFFGFIKWDTYFATGAWSIGNELVFYVFFPFFILFTKSYKILMALLSLLILGLYIYFAFYKLDSSIPLNNQWYIYTNPLNQVFLFLSGYLIGLFMHKLAINNLITCAILIFGLALFIFYPAGGNVIQIVTGTNRIIFTASCILICIGFFKLTYEMPALIHKPFTLLGEISYSVYLVHPLVYKSLKYVSKKISFISEGMHITISILLTLIISYIIYEYFEKFFMRVAASKKKQV